MILPKTSQVLVSLSSKKPIFAVKDDPSLFVKIISLAESSKRKILNEVKFQKKAYKLGIPCPKIYDNYWHNDSMYIIMEKIRGDNLANIYGENPKRIPNKIWSKIRYIISTLKKKGIEYFDITPYNFMQVNDKVYIIDFEHCNRYEDSFIEEFLQGNKIWNPYFL